MTARSNTLHKLNDLVEIPITFNVCAMFGDKDEVYYVLKPVGAKGKVAYLDLDYFLMHNSVTPDNDEIAPDSALKKADKMIDQLEEDNSNEK